MNNEFTDTELENEQWRDIEGYDGMYQVSDLGRVRSRYSGEWRVMKPSKNGNGYLFVDLYKDGKSKNFRIHRLVAQAFIPNDDETKTIINHRNSIRDCNRVDNLEWCDYQYNNTYLDIQFRKKNSKRRKIEKLYRPELSYKENYKIFKENGIDCSEMVIRCLRRDLGLICHQPKLSKIKSLYNPELTINENLEVFRANGIECCDKTVQRLRKDLGLTKQYELKQEKIKDLYNPELTINENLNVFRSKGIECCVGTVINLRKELNLEPHQNYKRHKLKDLYRPELTIKQNIALFKEQGIDCSKSTVIKLRKDLGLIK